MKGLTFSEQLAARGLAERAEEIRRRHGCTLDELRSGRQRHQVEARRVFARWLTDELHWSGSAVARLLACHPSTVTSLLRGRA